ncbi:RelA/SpoT domain-containing protein [Microvirga tunisiensis]|nr:hypothetical protein [Microvirga tunisiensis]
MHWVKPAFSRSQVDRAGKFLATGVEPSPETSQALEVVNNWRAAHAFPLNTMHISLRRLATEADPDALTAQRLKRVESILRKLQRNTQMSLCRMQDIGGCRAVVRTVADVYKIRESYRRSRIKHHLANEKDYIQQPKISGYRGIHLVYKYNSDRTETYNNQQIELQIRSAIQHYWATAVETVGTFLDQSLKSSEGSEEWLRFFSYTSSLFAHKEGTPPLANAPNKSDLIVAIRAMADQLRVRDTLTVYRNTLMITEDHEYRRAHYFLLLLEPEAGRLEVRSYRSSEITRAAEEYLEVESELTKKPGAQAVLVSVEHLDSLRRAFPNYFLDTESFLGELDDVLG